MWWWIGLVFAAEDVQLSALESALSETEAARAAAVALAAEPCRAALDLHRGRLTDARAASVPEVLGLAAPLFEVTEAAGATAAAPLSLVPEPPLSGSDKAVRAIRTAQNVLGVVGSLTTTAGLVLGVVPFPEDVAVTVDQVAGGVAAGGAALNMVGSVAGLIAGAGKGAAPTGVAGIPLPTKQKEVAVSPGDPAARAVATGFVEQLQAQQRRLATLLDVSAPTARLPAAWAQPGAPVDAVLAVAPSRMTVTRGFADQLQLEARALTDLLDRVAGDRASALIEGLEPLREGALVIDARVAAWRAAAGPVWERAAMAWSSRPEAGWSAETCPAPVPPPRGGARPR